ncbi:MAG: DUF1428 domain-containing protein [Verrucomicrobiota bacterium JB022]|nr:DUF1428 domain-containing protein [Verrucomicrobiota bacterium JB022]
METQSTSSETTQNLPYVDGFVLVIAKENVEQYRKMAAAAGKIWREHGALAFMETVGDDLEAKDHVPFPKMAQAKEGETVVFSWIVYQSREQRDAVNAKVMADQRIHDLMQGPDIFDCKRIAYGGFRTIVSL